MLIVAVLSGNVVPNEVKLLPLMKPKHQGQEKRVTPRPVEFAGLRPQQYGQWGPWMGKAFASCPDLQGQMGSWGVWNGKIWGVRFGIYNILQYRMSELV